MGKWVKKRLFIYLFKRFIRDSLVKRFPVVTSGPHLRVRTWAPFSIGSFALKFIVLLETHLFYRVFTANPDSFLLLGFTLRTVTNHSWEPKTT